MPNTGPSVSLRRTVILFVSTITMVAAEGSVSSGSAGSAGSISPDATSYIAPSYSFTPHPSSNRLD